MNTPSGNLLAVLQFQDMSSNGTHRDGGFEEGHELPGEALVVDDLKRCILRKDLKKKGWRMELVGSLLFVMFEG